jgi:hypothetical protein
MEYLLKYLELIDSDTGDRIHGSNSSASTTSRTKPRATKPIYVRAMLANCLGTFLYIVHNAFMMCNAMVGLVYKHT